MLGIQHLETPRNTVASRVLCPIDELKTIVFVILLRSLLTGKRSLKVHELRQHAYHEATKRHKDKKREDPEAPEPRAMGFLLVPVPLHDRDLLTSRGKSRLLVCTGCCYTPSAAGKPLRI